jgi:hypothetical protein
MPLERMPAKKTKEAAAAGKAEMAETAARVEINVKI